MKPLYLLSTLVFTMLAGSTSFAQDFSNKGKDFWVGYGYHAEMSLNTQDMVLYFVTETITTVTVTIPGIGYSQTYSNIPANTVFTSNPIPKTGLQDARLNTESFTPENKGIHITSDKPIIAYAHVYNLNASGATILFPTPILGKEYYSVNYTNISNSFNSNCWFYVVACDTGTTTVEITPSAATINHAAGIPFTVNLTQGQIYNIMGQFTNSQNQNPTSIGVDLTGSKIRSISSGTGGCKKIAVFSGSGRISITCDGTSSSSDNYMVQAFPKSAWGKKYLTTPSGGVMPNNFFRICVLDPATVVTVNNAPIGLPLQNNFYYEIGPTKTPLLIEADKPVLVVQYITSQGACGNGAQPGDPEVIYLSPVEQNINRVLWNATSNYKILQHYYNVVIPNTGTAISSFKLDGVTVPAGLFITHLQAPGYSYITQSVTAGQHSIISDSGFNAIAYGYGNAESYGYNAGTNVRDLYQFISVQNKYATVNFPASCRNSPFYFSMTFPYQPNQVQWIFGPVLNAMGITDVLINSPVYDSTWSLNGKQLYRYKLTTSYTVNATGSYPIRILTQNPTPEGCSGEQEVDFDLQVFDPPVADFSFTNKGCLNDPVQFTSNSTSGGRTITVWNWDFNDGNTSNNNNPSHTYLAAGSYSVKYSLITDVGCISDTASHLVTVNALPTADFNTSVPGCETRNINFTDASVANSGALVKWTWDYGDGSDAVLTTAAPFNHVYTAAGTYNVTLTAESNKGCKSLTKNKQVIINPVPKAGFISPEVCLTDPAAPFIDTSKIAPGNIAAWDWNFGDPGASGANPNISTLQNPAHHYSVVGSYTASLIVTSNNGCRDTIAQTFTVNGSIPLAGFTVQNPNTLCSNQAISIADASTVNFGNIVKVEIYWDYANNPTVKTIEDVPLPGQIYTHAYPEFGTPDLKTYTIKYVAYSGINCVNSFTKDVTVLATPVLQFDPINPVCSNAPSFQVTGVQLLNGLQGTAVFSGTGISSAGLFNPFIGAGIYTIRYTYTAANSCSNYAEQTVEVYATPVVNAGPDKVVLEGGVVTLTPASNMGLTVTYLWTPSTSLSDPEKAFVVASPADDITYTFTVTTDKGCYASDQVFVKVLKSLVIPNIFSPNGDGIHDKWEIDFLESYPGCTVEIYNRYGQLIYHSVGYSQPWDGTINGKQAPVGTYYYIVDPKNGRKKLAGYVDIIR